MRPAISDLARMFLASLICSSKTALVIASKSFSSTESLRPMGLSEETEADSNDNDWSYCRFRLEVKISGVIKLKIQAFQAKQ